MLDRECMKEDFNPLLKSKDYLQYKIEFAKAHKDYFYPDGLTLFVGPQGSGKTLSAVNYVYRLMKKYPKAKLITNLLLADYPIITFEEWKHENIDLVNKIKEENIMKSTVAIEGILLNLYKENNRVFPFNNQDDLQRYENGEHGVIYLIDEIQLYFNSLESKNINMEVMVQVSQQRKQRKHIIGTSQVFGRMAKPLREQFNIIVACKWYAKFIQCNKAVNRDDIEESTDDMHVTGKVMFKSWFIHTPAYYKRYDTYYTISRTKFVSNEKKVGDIYDLRLSNSN